MLFRSCSQLGSVQSLSRVRLFATPCIAARQASLSTQIQVNELTVNHALVLCTENTEENKKESLFSRNLQPSGGGMRQKSLWSEGDWRSCETRGSRTPLLSSLLKAAQLPPPQPELDLAVKPAV